MESDYETKNWDPRNDLTIQNSKKKKITRNKLLQTTNRKYADKSHQPGSGIKINNKRHKYLGGISKGYLDTGTITNTMRLYNKASENASSRRQRLKKIGNYQKKALRRLTGYNSKRKLRDLATLISEDDGDIEDEDNNDMLDEEAKDNSMEPDNDVNMTNESLEKNTFFASGNTPSKPLLNAENLFVSSSDANYLTHQISNQNSINDNNIAETTSRDTYTIIPTLSNHTSSIVNEGMNVGESNVYINTNSMSEDKDNKILLENDITNTGIEPENGAQRLSSNEPAINNINVSHSRGILSNDGEYDYDDSEFGYDGDDDTDGDDAQRSRKKEARRRKQLESDFDEQFFMVPGTQKIDQLISDTFDNEEPFQKSSVSPSLNIGLNVGKRRRRSSNYQDTPQMQTVIKNVLPTTGDNDVVTEDITPKALVDTASTNNVHPDNKKTKIGNKAIEFAIEGSFVDSMNQKNKKLKRKHMKPPKLLIEPGYKKPLTIKDIRDLVIYCFNKTEKSKPAWCRVENRMNLEKIVVLQIPGAQPKDLNYNGQSLKSFEELLNDKDKIMFTKESFFEEENTLTLSSKAPGNGSFVFSAFSAFTNVPLPKQKQHAIINKLSKKQPNIRDLLLKIEDFIELQYPLHPELFSRDRQMQMKVEQINSSLDDADSWVDTIPRGPIAYVSHIYALDCEMCLTEKGHELTRVCLIGYNGTVVYDVLVKPKNPIIDYLTKYSGITKEMMSKAVSTLPMVQKMLLQIIDCRDIIIGHSLQSDFKALKLRHCRVIDTAVIYEHVKGPPFKPALRNLSSIYLGKEIQNNDAEGHDPCIDARTCLELVKLKLEKGLQIGLNLNSETIFKNLEDSSNVKSLVFNKFAPDEAITDLNEKSNMKTISFDDDEDIVNKIIKNLDTCSLFVGKLNTLENTRYFAGKSTSAISSLLDDNMDTLQKSESMTDEHVDAIKEQQAIKSLKKTLHKLTENLCSNSMVILFSGSGDLRNYKKIISEINSIRMPEKRKSYSLLKKDELKQAVDVARDSVITIYIKK